MLHPVKLNIKIKTKLNEIIFLYVDSFFMDIARKKEYVITLYECVEFYKIIDNYREKHFENYYKIYKYIKENRNKNLELLIRELNDKFHIEIGKMNKLIKN